MKKLATTFGLVALMLVVTSFTTPTDTGGRGGKGTSLGDGGQITSDTGGRGGKGTSLGDGGQIFSETGGKSGRGGKGTSLGDGGQIFSQNLGKGISLGDFCNVQ